MASLTLIIYDHSTFIILMLLMFVMVEEVGHAEALVTWAEFSTLEAAACVLWTCTVMKQNGIT